MTNNLRKIVIVSYNPLWPQMFEEEAAKISAVFGTELISIHHIGSTSIPGLSAKPIIDIMPIVRSVETVDAFNPAMIELGYEPKGENGISGRRYFQKGGQLNRSHHVHTYEATNPAVKEHLDLRDYLIAHPDDARQYGELKEELALKFPHDIEGYINGKDAFVKEIIRRAAEWRRSV
jgi:GrpB-like predicted nucleotidyltransferase (UPF0157 family)